MKRVLGIVPARAGSQRLPGKNLLPLGGKPLAAWAIEAALRARTLQRVIVTSDDPRILELAQHYDADLPLVRPPHLATATATALSYVRHALDALEARGEGPYDTVAIVQPSSPLTRPEDIDATVTLLHSSGGTSAVTVQRVAHALHPMKFKTLENDRLRPYLQDEGQATAAHELPDVYIRNGAVYAAARSTIDGGSLLGHDSRAWVMPRERSLDINDAVDYAFGQFLHGGGAPCAAG